MLHQILHMEIPSISPQPHALPSCPPGQRFPRSVLRGDRAMGHLVLAWQEVKGHFAPRPFAGVETHLSPPRWQRRQQWELLLEEGGVRWCSRSLRADPSLLRALYALLQVRCPPSASFLEMSLCRKLLCVIPRGRTRYVCQLSGIVPSSVCYWICHAILPSSLSSSSPIATPAGWLSSETEADFRVRPGVGASRPPDHSEHSELHPQPPAFASYLVGSCLSYQENVPAGDAEGIGVWSGQWVAVLPASPHPEPESHRRGYVAEQDSLGAKLSRSKPWGRPLSLQI